MELSGMRGTEAQKPSSASIHGDAVSDISAKLVTNASDVNTNTVRPASSRTSLMPTTPPRSMPTPWNVCITPSIRDVVPSDCWYRTTTVPHMLSTITWTTISSSMRRARPLRAYQRAPSRPSRRTAGPPSPPWSRGSGRRSHRNAMPNTDCRARDAQATARGSAALTPYSRPANGEAASCNTASRDWFAAVASASWFFPTTCGSATLVVLENNPDSAPLAVTNTKSRGADMRPANSVRASAASSAAANAPDRMIRRLRS